MAKSFAHLLQRLFIVVAFFHWPKYKTLFLRLTLRLQHGQLFLQRPKTLVRILPCKQLLFDINHPTSDFIDLGLHLRIGVSSLGLHALTGVITRLAFRVLRIVLAAPPARVSRCFLSCSCCHGLCHKILPWCWAYFIALMKN